MARGTMHRSARQSITMTVISSTCSANEANSAVLITLAPQEFRRAAWGIIEVNLVQVQVIGHEPTERAVNRSQKTLARRPPGSRVQVPSGPRLS